MCNQSFGGFWELQKHLSTHKVADQAGSENSNLNCHSDEYHENGNEHSHAMGMAYSIGEKIWRSTTDELAQVQCEVCKKWMKNRNILRAHAIIHDEAPIQCPHCDKIKLNIRSLNAHISQCHSNRKHQCTFCAKSFARAEKLKVGPLEFSLCSFKKKTNDTIIFLGAYRSHPQEKITL